MFEDKAMKTPIYVKMDGWMSMISFFCQKGCVGSWESCHTILRLNRRGKGKPNHDNVHISRVPIVKVWWVKTVRLLPHQSVPATVECVPNNPKGKLFLMGLEGDEILQSDDVLFKPFADGHAHLILSNLSVCTCILNQGICIGEAFKVTDDSYPKETVQGQCSVNLSVRKIWPELDKGEQSKFLQHLVVVPTSLDIDTQEELYRLLESHTIRNLVWNHRNRVSLIWLK